MNQIFNSRNTFTCFVSLLAVLVTISLVRADNHNELMDAFKVPLLSASLGVSPDKENYTDEDEGRALIKVRSLLTKLNEFPLEGKLDEENGNYLSVLGTHYAVSTGGIDGWNYDIPFSMPIVVWNGGEPTTKLVDQEGYLVELNRYSNSQVAGYLVEDKVAYVVLELPDQSEFQVLELAWSDRQLPYFNGYYFQISSDPVPDTRAVVFEPEFLKKLQAKLLTE